MCWGLIANGRTYEVFKARFNVVPSITPAIMLRYFKVSMSRPCVKQLKYYRLRTGVNGIEILLLRKKELVQRVPGEQHV